MIGESIYKKHASSSEAGYTLVEVLIALSLVALLSVGLVSGIGTGTRVWERVDQRSQVQSEAVVLEDVIRRHLQKAVPVTLDVGGRRRAVFFDGTGTRIRFLTAAGAGVASRGIFGEELEIIDAEAGPVLQLRRAADPLRRSGQSPATWDVISIPLSGGGLAFEYFGAEGNDSHANWQGRWQERNTLPELIRLSASVDGGADSDFIEIVVRPHLITSNISVSVQSVSSFFEGGGA